MEYHNYSFSVNYISSLLLVLFVFILIVFIGIKAIALSKGSNFFLAKNSGNLIFATIILIILSLCAKYYSENLIVRKSLQLLLNENVAVKINGQIAKREFSHYFRKSIANIIQFKDKGSSPTKRTYVELYIEDELLMKYILRKDSRDFNMYWIRAISQNYKIDLGYIKLEQKILDSSIFEPQEKDSE